MIDYRKGREIAGNVGETIWANSVPLALVGAGLGWFLMTSSGKGSGSRATRGRGRRGAGTTAPGDQQGAGQQHGATQDHGQTNGGSHGMYESVRDTVGEQANRVYRRASSGFSQIADEQPLLLGAAGLVLGAALGAVLPNTRYENELLGDTRDDLTRGVKDFGREQYEKAQRVVERTVDVVRQEADRQGFSAQGAREAVEEVTNRAGTVAGKVAEAVREETGLSAGKQGERKKEAGSGGSKGSTQTDTPTDAARGEDLASRPGEKGPGGGTV